MSTKTVSVQLLVNPGKGIDPSDCVFSFAHESGRPIKSYDDGDGVWRIHRNSIGISGIVRARTFGDAYEICENEFFPAADETAEDLRKKYGFRREHVRQPDGSYRTVDTPIGPEDVDSDYGWTMNPLFQEAYGFRPSGGEIYSKDLNGDSLDVLTPELAERLGIVITITFDGDCRD